MFKILRKKTEVTSHPVAIAFIAAIKEDPTRLAVASWIRVKQQLLEELSIEEREWVAVELRKIRLDHISVEIARLRLTGDTGEDQSKFQTNTIVTGLEYITVPIGSAGV